MLKRVQDDETAGRARWAETKDVRAYVDERLEALRARAIAARGKGKKPGVRDARWAEAEARRILAMMHMDSKLPFAPGVLDRLNAEHAARLERLLEYLR